MLVLGGAVALVASVLQYFNLQSGVYWEVKNHLQPNQGADFYLLSYSTSHVDCQNFLNTTSTSTSPQPQSLPR